MMKMIPYEVAQYNNSGHLESKKIYYRIVNDRGEYVNNISYRTRPECWEALIKLSKAAKDKKL